VNRRASNPLLGKWRIIQTDLWEADYLDMLEPAFIEFKRDGLGEFRFGCVIGGLDCHYMAHAAHFTWQGSDEMDEVCGDGVALLEDDGNLTGEISFHLGDETTFKAKKW
jgi:hypothetical protein